MRKPKAPPPQRPGETKTFDIFGHHVAVTEVHGFWLLSVDGGPAFPQHFATAAEAWTAGINEVERLRRQGGSDQ
jgi:hypothetical protein